MRGNFWGMKILQNYEKSKFHDFISQKPEQCIHMAITKLRVGTFTIIVRVTDICCKFLFLKFSPHTVLSPPSTQVSTQMVGFIWHTDDSGHKCKTRPRVVDQTPQLLEWLEHQGPISILRHGDRFLHDRLGSHLHGNKDWGLCFPQEHISWFELQAGKFAVRSFMTGQFNMHVLFVNGPPDSSLICVNKMGGTHSQKLMQACHLWHLQCLRRGILTISKSLQPVKRKTWSNTSPSKGNLIEIWIFMSRERIALFGMRCKDSEIVSNTLRREPTMCTGHCGRQFRIQCGNSSPTCSWVFRGLVCQFATCLNHQLPRYVCWRPDPFAMTMDTFSFSWQGLQGYAFLPFALFGKCLQKIREERNTVVLIAPHWQV